MTRAGVHENTFPGNKDCAAKSKNRHEAKTALENVSLRSGYKAMLTLSRGFLPKRIISSSS